MKTEPLIKHIENLDFENFLKDWDLLKDQSTEVERQELLLEIFENLYHKANFSFFVKVFDEILKIKTSLDFNINRWAPTFLSSAVDKSSMMVMQYFLRKGANVNFAGDLFFNYTEDEMKYERGAERYQTCLDFANLKYSDMFSCDYNFSPPMIDIEECRQNEDASEPITISKGHYFDLVEQAIYLQDLIHLDRVLNYIKSIGGKTYSELQSKKMRKNEEK